MESKYTCTNCQKINEIKNNGEITVGFCINCGHPLWNTDEQIKEYSQQSQQGGLREALSKIANSNAKLADDKNVLKAQIAWIRMIAKEALNSQPIPQKDKLEELKKGLKSCPNHPDVLVSQCGICDGTFPKKRTS